MSRHFLIFECRTVHIIPIPPYQNQLNHSKRLSLNKKQTKKMMFICYGRKEKSAILKRKTSTSTLREGPSFVRWLCCSGEFLRWYSSMSEPFHHNGLMGLCFTEIPLFTQMPFACLFSFHGHQRKRCPNKE